MARAADRQAQESETGAERLASEAETAEYIADLLEQLEMLARTHGLVELQYLLMQSREEAVKAAAA
ncbi:MAG: hypothetical protein R3C60_09600 [Parvularculaceae bacterium]